MSYTPPEGVTIGTFAADTLPATFNAPAGAGISYKIYGTEAGAGTATSESEPEGYKITLSVDDAHVPIYIGDSKLTADEYVDSESGKVYKLKEVHQDTVTIDGVVWDIIGYDHDEVYDSLGNLAQHSVTIQTHECISELQFDNKEAMFAFDEGLAAGTYHFTVGAQPWVSGDVGKTVQFAITSDIPAGGQIVFGNVYNATMIGATISVFAGPTATTASETATLSEGTDGTDLGTLSNATNGAMNSVQRGYLGSNNYNESAIRQYLNSDKAAGSVWTPQTKWDRPPSWAASTAGFLRGFNSDFISSIGKASKRTAKNTVSDGGGYIDTEEKIFLLSRTEVYAGPNNNVDEGGPYRYFSEFSDLSSAGTGADSNRTKYRNSVAKYWWLRSPFTGYASLPFGANLSGTVNYLSSATYVYGVAPACCIVLDDINTNPYLQSLFLKPIEPPTPLPAITASGETTITTTETLGDIDLSGDWLAIMGSTEDESIDIVFTVDAEEYIAFVTVDDDPQIQVSDTITMPSSADSFTLEVVSWGRERYTDTVYNALS